MRHESFWRLVMRRFGKRRLATLSAYLLVLLGCVALLAPLLANSTPLAVKWNATWHFPLVQQTLAPDQGESWAQWHQSHPDARVINAIIPHSPNDYDLEATLSSPSATHWCGTDEQGRDILSRLIYGSRVSLSVGFVAVGIYMAIGIVLGLLAGYFGGVIDTTISRLIEMMVCFPTFFLILTVLAMVGPSIYNIMIIIGLTGWPGIARLVRGECLRIKEMEYVSAARALGAGHWRIMLVHLLPNALAPVLVSATFGVAAAILVESSLSFLGFGVPPHVPSWGDVLSQSREYMDIAWWLALFPGVAIFGTIAAYNFVGEGLQDALHPRMRS